MSFENYLTETKKLSLSTGKEYGKYKKHFLVWLDKEYLSVESLCYKDLIHFITCKQASGYKKRYINAQLSAIKYYLDYLAEKGIIFNNVGSGLFIRGRRITVPSGLLSMEELVELYEKYEIKTDNKQHYPGMVRNKVITGLMVFQGLLPDEMQQLKYKRFTIRKRENKYPLK